MNSTLKEYLTQKVKKGILNASIFDKEGEYHNKTGDLVSLRTDILLIEVYENGDILIPTGTKQKPGKFVTTNPDYVCFIDKGNIMICSIQTVKDKIRECYEYSDYTVNNDDEYCILFNAYSLEYSFLDMKDIENEESVG